MKKNIFYLLSGIIFSLGLGISGMLEAEKIKHFLQIFYPETWAPDLLIVLLSAAAVYALVYWKQVKCGKSCTTDFCKVPQGKVDSQLLAGAALFGLGWGLTGLCPAPAVARLGLFPLELSTWAFVLAMFAGFKIQEKISKK